ncbi:MAG: hypothetical protein RLZZ399_379 [Verrucomicrobiota bacterium]|jgi:glycosyltransferase involved in cell wall biosynthesis
MQSHPEVSLIVPAYNTGRFVAETIRSIQVQDFQDWECVIVDDGSNDGTAAEVERAVRGDSRFRLIRQNRQGVSRARNRGFWEASREAGYVCFMDSDDCWKPGALSVLLEAVRRSPECIGAHALGEFISCTGSAFQDGAFEAFGRRRLGYWRGAIREWPLDKPSCFASLCWTGTVYPPGLLLTRRRAYEAAGLFDETMQFCEDWDMVVRLSRHGDIQFVNRVILGYRRHEWNATRDLSGNSCAARRLHHKTFFSPENSPEHREILREGWLAWQRFKVLEKWRLARKGVSHGSGTELVQAVLGTPLHALRYLRGHPSLGRI